MRVFVTGVPGWLGDRFMEILVYGYEGILQPGEWDLRCLVLPGSNVDHLRGLSQSKDIECVYGDVTKPETLKNALKGIDIVFHLVGVIHPKWVGDFFAINKKGTENILKASVEAGVRKFIHVSSNSVCGVTPSPRHLFTENDKAKPYMNYGKSKYQAEKAVLKYQKSKKMQTVILRPCWYYGPNQPPRQSTFFQMIKKGNPILFGDGKNVRSMSYLDNVSQAMILSAKSEKANGQTYWIADEKPYTTLEIYQTIADLLGVKKFRPRYIPSFISEACLFTDALLQMFGLYNKEIHVAGEMNKNIACSVQKAKNELGYDPRISLREGMRRSIEWCRSHGMDI